MELCFYVFFIFLFVKISSGSPIEVATTIPENVIKILNNTRRIISGSEVAEGREYMVYLKTPMEKAHTAGRNWLCGGIIVHDEYILTSAACIQDVEHFYVVSGTYKFSETANKENNQCIKNSQRKAVWKCLPKNYDFDGKANDNIKWMNNDIAVVKIEDGFDFGRRQKGCDFVPRPIMYNNHSQALENPGSLACIAGWGTSSEWGTGKDRQQNLMEAQVEIIPKSRCKRRWGLRYKNIIDNYMICSKDIGQTMHEICSEKYVDCQDIDYSDSDEGRRVIKSEPIPKNLKMHSAMSDRYNDTRRDGWFGMSKADGGFCENDHGGPMVSGNGAEQVAIGIISACLVKERSNKCYGPFLYTSIYKNRQFISCAIFKDIEECRRSFRAGFTHEERHISWANHPDGPAKGELNTAMNGK